MRKYTKEHQWIELQQDGTAKVGITQYAANELGEITFIELPAMDKCVHGGEPLCVVESVKAARHRNRRRRQLPPGKKPRPPQRRPRGRRMDLPPERPRRQCPGFPPLPGTIRRLLPMTPAPADVRNSLKSRLFRLY